MDNQQVTETDLAWLAGFIDGEGSIGIYGNTPRKDNTRSCLARIQISSANGHAIKKVIEICKEMNIAVHIYNRKFDNPKYSDSFYTTINRMQAIARLLPRIIPYLIIKKPHAQLMLEWIESRIRYGINRGGNTKLNAYTEKEKDLVKALQELNQRKGNPTDYTCDPLLEGEDIVGH